MELLGTIKEIHDVQNFASGFQRRDFVLVTEEKFPQTLLIETSADRIDILDPFKPGDIVRVGINIKGKEWTSPDGSVKYFTSLSAWKVTHKLLANSTTFKTT